MTVRDTPFSGMASRTVLDKNALQWQRPAISYNLGWVQLMKGYSMGASNILLAACVPTEATHHNWHCMPGLN